MHINGPRVLMMKICCCATLKYSDVPVTVEVFIECRLFAPALNALSSHTFIFTAYFFVDMQTVASGELSLLPRVCVLLLVNCYFALYLKVNLYLK